MARIKYLEAAGLEVKRGRPPAGLAPSKADLVKLYVKEAQSVRDVAAVLGCSKDMVHRVLRKFRVEARSGDRRRSILLLFCFVFLKSAIQEIGIRRYDSELGIFGGTLCHHLKVRNK